MKKGTHILLYQALIMMALSSCTDDEFIDNGWNGAKQKIEVTGDIQQIPVTRVNDNGFVDGDVIGVYIVDYDGSTPGQLRVNGNRGDNVRYSYEESTGKWTPANEVYWKDKHTHIDVYGYYPAASPESVTDYAFSVQRDQSKPTEGGNMGGYEASDFLWGKAEDGAPAASIVHLTMSHRMANARVTLVEGSGFAQGEWASTDKQVLTMNLVREASINLSNGTVKPNGSVESTATVPSRVNDEWRTIVVPQTMAAGTTMFSITIGGVPYKFSKSEAFTYQAGKISNFAIRVDKKAPSGQYTLTIISESITAWENDLVSHDATAKDYLVIHSTAGHLKEAIKAAGKDYMKVKNLKITGQINPTDFLLMRDSMPSLTAVNMKEVRIKGGHDGVSEPGKSPIWGNDDEIPDWAFAYKSGLVYFVFPDTLKKIKSYAFASTGISGSLIIPEGVEEIEFSAFGDCFGLTGSLSLPSTLKRITGQNVFLNDQFTCELVLPEGLEEICSQAFLNCSSFYGSLRLPESLKYIGEAAFANCHNLEGDLEIPQNITKILPGSFSGCSFGGNLKLHDGIVSIGGDAFSGCFFRGELILPKNLVTIEKGSFYNNDFSGTLKLPAKLVSIGDKAFAYNWRLMGTLEFPEDVISIGSGAFAHCRSIEGLVFPAGLENIRYEASYYEDGGAFQGCYGIGSIVCKGDMPPYVQPGAFDGVAKDNFTLEVPESAIQLYQTALGWCEFKRIAAHHELVCRPSVACALATEHKQTLVINAEGEWEVASKPSWCVLSQNSGNKKTEITLTIKAMAKGSGDRQGDIIFRLKDKEYTHTCTVTQKDYAYDEDQWLSLQNATKGNNGGINIVFIGDGYDASDIASGQYLQDMQQGMDYFFGIEPYTTYRNYFNVSTAFALSVESGVGTVNSIRYNRFNTTFTGGVGLKCDFDELFDYVLSSPKVTSANLSQTLIIVIPNSTDYAGLTWMWEDGSAIAFCPKSNYGYPLDSRGVMQHEAGGHGFGKLGDEYIYHNAFIDACGCTCCGHVDAILGAQQLGWYQNLSLTGKTHQVPWSHFIFDSRYSDIVEIYEGAYMHTRGVFRSEQNSCMNNEIPYYNTISREAIVKRIKQYAGEQYSFDGFVRNDKRDAGTLTRAIGEWVGYKARTNQMVPKIMKGSPLKGRQSKSNKTRR